MTSLSESDIDNIELDACQLFADDIERLFREYHDKGLPINMDTSMAILSQMRTYLAEAYRPQPVYAKWDMVPIERVISSNVIPFRRHS